jgi:hypothetical protein
MSRRSLSTDWFNRRLEYYYTYYDSSKRLFYWDKGIDNYSSYFMANNPVSDAGKFLGSMFKVLGVPTGGKYSTTGNQTLKQVLDGAGNYKGKVQVPINMLRNEDGTYVEDNTIVDAFYGAALQNACMASMQTKSEYVRSLELRGYTPDGKEDKKIDGRSDTTKYLASLLNSERIDKKLGDQFPGYLKFVQKYKNHAYANLQEDDIMSEMMKDKGAKLLDLVTKMIRYPVDLSEDELTEFAEPLQKIKELIQREGGIPGTLSKCEDVAGKLAKLLYEIEPPPPSDGCSGGDDKKEGDGDGKDESDDDKESKGSGSGDSSGGSPMDEAARKMMRDLLNSGMKTDGETARESSDIKEFDKSTVELDGFNEEGEVYSSTVNFKDAKGDKGTYMNIREKLDMSKAQTLARLFARKNKDYAFSMKSMRSGRLDTDKLAEAKQGVPSIYERMGQVKTNKICVGVLIDESGSMGGHKIQKAREAAIFINEIFKKIPNVELFIYGHSADITEEGTTDMITYREPGKSIDMYALGSCHARIENRDGDAILAVGNRMRKFTQNNGLLFVISDGAPCADRYHGTSAIEDTRVKVLKTEGLGLQVIQIAIENSVPSEKMFKHHIKMTDIKNLPNDMVGFLSRKIDHLIKEKVFM